MKIIKIEDPLEKSRICERVLRSLPEWFGIESAIIDYISDVQQMDTWAAIDSDAIGFISRFSSTRRLNDHKQEAT